MPYPVTPPELPPIVSPFTSEDTAQSLATSVSKPAADKPALRPAPTRLESSTSPAAIRPEFSATDSSSFVDTSAKSAAGLLGSPVTVGLETPENTAQQPNIPVFHSVPPVPPQNPPVRTPAPAISQYFEPTPVKPASPLPARALEPPLNGRASVGLIRVSPEAWLKRVIAEDSRRVSAPTKISQIRDTSPIIEIPSTPPPPSSPNDPFSDPPSEIEPEAEPTDPPAGSTPANPSVPPPQSPPANRPTNTKPPTTPGQPGSSSPPNLAPGIIELTADRQEYDEQRQIFTAEGNVVMRYQGAVLDADRLQVNLLNRIAVAEGNVALTRGEQVLRGQRFEYNFVQESGTVFNARGELYLPSSESDFAPGLANDPAQDRSLARPLSDRLIANQPTSGVSSPGGVNIVGGSRRNVGGIPIGRTGGRINRVRYEAERVDFGPRQSVATQVRITNDPFSPPELELRTPQATFTRLSPLRDEIRAVRPRLVFDQGFSLPLFRNRIVLDRRERDPGLVNFGFDDEDRGGLFIERSFEPIANEQVRLSLTPQFFVQRAFEEGINSNAFGLRSRFDATLGPRTNFQAAATINSFDADEFRNQLRVRTRLNQLIGSPARPHAFGLEYTYRERIFNGSLGFRTVQSSIGAVLDSPVIPLGKTGITLSYQLGIQNISADTDRADLLEPIRENNRVNLTRYQANVALSRGFLLWQGKPLPATATQGLRFTPNPVTPYIAFGVGLRGTLSAYSNGDNQNLLLAGVGLSGQFGHFSRSFLDYTGFNIGYSEIIGRGLSPFLFDRAVDDRVLSFGLVQQLYGPFRIGFQTSVNLESNQRISTDYFLEYSRRTYGILLRYNPVLEIGSISLRISDFNWNGGTQPFDGVDVRPVEAGVQQ
jgi:hypothetical protein